MDEFARLSDAKLLATARQRPEGFGEFYARSEDAVLLFFLSRGAGPQLAADLAAETFAAALLSAHCYSEAAGGAISWLYTIARNVLAMSRRAGAVEHRARARLGIGKILLGPDERLAIAALDVDDAVLGHEPVHDDYPPIGESIDGSVLMAAGDLEGTSDASTLPLRIPQLRNELVRAAGQHMPMRRRPHRTRLFGFLAATLVFGALVAPATATTREDVRRATRIFNHAVGVVMRDRSCQPQFSSAKEIHEAPSAELLNAFAVLRRPVTDADRTPEGDFKILPAGEIFIDYVRTATASDGRQFWVIPARELTPFSKVPLRCLHRIRAGSRRAARTKGLEVRRLVRSFYVGFARHYHQPQRLQDTVWFFTKGPNGGGGTGGGQIKGIVEDGMFMSTGLRKPRTSMLQGLIPDGVTEIDFSFARVYQRGRTRRVYDRVEKLRATVQENVVSLSVPRDPEDAFPTKMVWLDANGQVVKTVDGFP